MPLLFHASYLVEPHDHGWTILFQGAPSGHYPSRREALRRAARDASFCRHLGHDVSLCIRGSGGRVRTVRIPSWDDLQDREPAAAP